MCRDSLGDMGDMGLGLELGRREKVRKCPRVWLQLLELIERNTLKYIIIHAFFIISKTHLPNQANNEIY